MQDVYLTLIAILTVSNFFLVYFLYLLSKDRHISKFLMREVYYRRFRPTRGYFHDHEMEWSHSFERRLIPPALEARIKLSDIVHKHSRKMGVSMTMYGEEMLALPLVEQVEQGDPVPWNLVDTSIESMMRSLGSSEIDNRDGGRLIVGDTISIIKTYARNFCNIPPFCKSTDSGL